MTKRALRMGLAGGGPGAFIGAVHRMGAELDRGVVLSAGAFSRDLEKSRQMARLWGIEPDRAYAGGEAMIAGEMLRDDPIDFVAIATPNDTHLPIALAAIEAGIPIICDKPATATLDEALDLAKALKRKSVPYALTFTYTGYPMLREARARVVAGRLGNIRRVAVSYSQGWLSEAIETQGQTQASWRTDPQRAGMGGCIGDIGVHAFNALEYVTGLRVERLIANLATHVGGRRVDDDANLLLVMENGATGNLAASQIATGARNNLRLEIYGELGGLTWSHERHDELVLDYADGRSETVRSGQSALSAIAAINRLPLGHPEGFIEAFANIYRDFAISISEGEDAAFRPIPGIEEGLRSMEFVEACVRSSQSKTWVEFQERKL